MRKALVTVYLSVICTILFSQNTIPVRFDEGVDLVSLVFRLAGAKEYNRCMLPAYSQSVDEHFAKFSQHSAVEYAKKCISESFVGYDAPASYAIHLVMPNDANSKITFNEQIQDGSDDSFDRFTKVQQVEFLDELNKFYRDTDFHRWYESTANFREEALVAFSQISQAVDTKWFDNFFGIREGAKFQLILSILNGQNNYGCSAKLTSGEELLSPVMGSCVADKDGKPVYVAKYVLPTIIHEFCHAYCNPLVAKHLNEMQKNAQKVFDYNATELSAMAYTTAQTMLNETFVRASVIRYLLATNPKIQAESLIEEEELQNFIMIRNFVEQLGLYEQERTKYERIEDFMPELVKTVNGFSVKKYANEKKKFAKNCAKYKCNIADGAVLSAGKYELIITFSKEMIPSISIGYSKSGAEFIPIDKTREPMYEWTDGNRVLHIYLNLESGKKYGFSVLGKYYKTTDGYNAGETEFIDFVVE